MPVVISGPTSLQGIAVVGSTLASLRTKVADRLNLLSSGAVSGTKADVSTTCFIDTSLVGEFENTFRNSWILFTSGSNSGSFRQVAGNKDGLICCKRAWGTAPAVGDAYELYRRFSPTAFKSAINWAIDNAYPWIYVRFEQEVPEVTTTMEYPYPALASPAAPTVVPTGANGTQTILYAIVSRSAAGDAVPSPSGTVVNAYPPSPGNLNTLTWTATSNADAFLVIRSADGGATWLLLTALSAAVVGSTMTFVDNGSYDSGSLAYTPASLSPSLIDLRQLWRRSNPLTTTAGVTTGNTLPPTYQEMRGAIWADLGKTVRVRWAPVSGQYLLFVGYARFAPLNADTDSVDQKRLPDELLIRGAAKILYESLAAGEASSSTIYYERQAKMWSDQYEAKRREYAMEQIGREQHPPESHVVRGPNLGVGPINPYGG